MVITNNENCQLKIALLGASCVGKTCIVKRFLENTFHGATYIPTPGADFGSRRIVLTKPIPTSVTLIIFDIGGTAINSKMLNVYLDSNIDIFMMVYDMTNMSSLNELRNWMEILQNFKLIKPDTTSIVLIGSKGDLEHLRTVRLDSHTKFTQEFGISLSFIVSAKSGDSVQTCFTNCVSYHLNPDTKKPFVREHTLTHGQLPKKLSAAMTSNNPHAVSAGSALNSATPSTSSSATIRQKQLQQQPSSTSGDNNPATNELNSAVCVVQ